MNEMKNVYTVYSEEHDMSFIMEETSDSLEVKGFYFGKPDEQATNTFYGKLKANMEVN